MAEPIDAFLKISITTAALCASASVGYYYVVYLPDCDAGIARLEKIEKAKAELARQVEQQVQRAQQQAAEERRANEQADIKAAYQACIDRAANVYDATWATTCKRLADTGTKDRADCLAKGNTFCDTLYKTRDSSSSCALPQALSSTINAALEKNRDRCLQESKSGLQ